MSSYFTVAQVARRFAVSPDTVRRWIRAKTLESINISPGPRPTYRVSEEALEKLYWAPVAPSEVVEFKFTKG